MSIQAIKPSTFLRKFSNLILIVKQIIARFFQVRQPKIFFRYINLHTHPTFFRYYENSPVKWANFYNFDLAHWINYPAFICKKPFILEVNDHPLSAVSYHHSGVKEPIEILSYIGDAKKVYEHKLCKKILIPSDGFKKLFHFYFGNEFDHKFIQVHSPGCLPRESIDFFNEDLPIIFSCLASDYFSKGVDILIDAWLNLSNKNKAKLILACPNIPEERLKYLNLQEGVEVIRKAPLSNQEKKDILTRSSVTLAPTHIHGGGNIIEGMEYGHSIVYFETHNTEFKNIGSEIQMPYHFYLPSEYGISWKTFKEFSQILISDKNSGKFISATNTLTERLLNIINQPNLINQNRAFVFGKAQEEFSLKNRNKVLQNLYKEIVGS